MCCARGGVANDANRASKRAGANAPSNDAASTNIVSPFGASTFTQRPSTSQEGVPCSGSALNAASTASHVGAVNSYATPGQFSKRPADDRCYEFHVVAGAAGCAIADRCFH